MCHSPGVGEFVEELCFPAIACNAIYENVYLLGMLSWTIQPNHNVSILT